MLIRVRVVSLGSAKASSGSFRFAWVHSFSRGLIWACLGVVGFIRVRVDSLGGPKCRRFHSGSFRFTRARLGVVGFIRVRGGSLVHS